MARSHQEILSSVVQQNKIRSLLKGRVISQFSACFVNPKGGATKSTTARMFARGLAELFEISGTSAVVWLVITDARDGDLHKESRGYLTVDGTTGEKLVAIERQITEMRQNGTNLFVVYDGAASRGVKHDLYLGSISDICLFPTRTSTGDLEVIFGTLARPEWQAMAKKLHVVRTCRPGSGPELVYAEHLFQRFWDNADFCLGNANLALPIPRWDLVGLIGESDAEWRNITAQAEAGAVATKQIATLERARTATKGKVATAKTKKEAAEHQKLVSSLTAEIEALRRATIIERAMQANFKRLDEMCRYTALSVLASAGIGGIKLPRYVTIDGQAELAKAAAE